VEHPLPFTLSVPCTGILSKLLGAAPNEMAGDTAQLSSDDVPFPELQLDDLFLPPRPIARTLYDYMFGPFDRIRAFLSSTDVC
jgi:hypothetical protein